MFKNLLMIVIVLLIIMVPLSCYGQNEGTSEPKVFKPRSKMPYCLTEHQIKLLEDMALRGSPGAAFRLFLCYEKYEYKKDHSKSLYWVRIAAQNGHPQGEYNYGLKLKDDPDPKNRLRAGFWLQRAAKQGVKEAEALLKEISEKPTEKAKP